MVKIPPHFNVFNEALDDNERFIRDQLKLDITNWAKFRYTIGVGNDAKRLVSKFAVPAEVKEAYRELAKSHYEVITSLGAARLAYDAWATQGHALPLLFKKSTKDFYFHLGCLLDNFARLIYILNAPNGATEKKGENFRRHWIDWGSLRSYPKHQRLRKSRNLKGIINIRNGFTHGWTPPTDMDGSTILWPLAIRTKRDFYWPYDEIKDLRREYRRWIPVAQMMQEDMDFKVQFQNKVFAKLVKDVRLFERQYRVLIK